MATGVTATHVDISFSLTSPPVTLKYMALHFAGQHWTPECKRWNMHQRKVAGNLRPSNHPGERKRRLPSGEPPPHE